MTRRRRLLMGLAAFMLSTAGCYVMLNVLALNVAVMVHRVVITVEVRDGTTLTPIAGAHASLKCDRSPIRDCGDTDARGTLVIGTSIGQQPLWVWPTIGTLDLSGWVLQVEARGYGRWTADLGPLVRPPLSNAIGTVPVRLLAE